MPFFLCVCARTQMSPKFLSDNVFQHTTPSQWHMPGWGGELQAFTALAGRTLSACQDQSYFPISTLVTATAERDGRKEFYIYVYSYYA